MMNPHFSRALVSILLTMGAPLAPGALNQKIVPADAQWLVHLDLDALRASGLGDELIALLPPMDLPVGNAGVRPNVRKILETIGSATGFGTDLSGKPEQIDGALILEGKPELRTIAEGLLTQMSVGQPDEVVERKDLPFEAYSIHGDIIVGLPREPIIIVGKSGDRLVKALEVYRGRAPSMAGNPSRLTSLVPSPQHFFVIAASVVPSAAGFFPGDAPQARILQMAQSASVALGEADDSTVVQLHLNASSSEMATKLERIVLGMAALVSLAESSDQALTDFLNSVTVKRENNMVMLHLAYPTERVVQMIREIQQAAQTKGTAQGVGGGAGQETESAASDDMGSIIAEWTADRDLPGDAPTPENLTSRTIDRVSLSSGATVIVAGRRGGGEHARVDFVEVAPVDGSDAPERYEGEDMRLSNCHIEEVSFASGGEVIRVEEGRGTARFRFRGAAGTYRLTVAYVDESDGRSTFALGIQTAPGK